MSLADLSFRLYSNAGLTDAIGSLISLLHKTNLSDNPQDFQMYFGSLGSGGLDTTDRQLKTQTAPGTNNIYLTPTALISAWQASHAYLAGDSRRPTVANGNRYEVSTAGTSGITEPTWPTSGIGSLVSDGTVVWKLAAPTHPVTELKLATTQAGLTGAIAGAALSLGNVVTSGTTNKIEVWARVTNTVTVVSSNVGNSELGLYITAVDEYSV